MYLVQFALLSLLTLLTRLILLALLTIEAINWILRSSFNPESVSNGPFIMALRAASASKKWIVSINVFVIFHLFYSKTNEMWTPVILVEFTLFINDLKFHESVSIHSILNSLKMELIAILTLLSSKPKMISAPFCLSILSFPSLHDLCFVSHKLFWVKRTSVLLCPLCVNTEQLPKPLFLGEEGGGGQGRIGKRGWGRWRGRRRREDRKERPRQTRFKKLQKRQRRRRQWWRPSFSFQKEDSHSRPVDAKGSSEREQEDVQGGR
jgi:hypothetical protein